MLSANGLHDNYLRVKASQLLAENVSALLKLKGLSQHDLAAWCRKSDPWVSQFLKGIRNWVIADLDRVADLLGVAVYQLLQPGISRTAERRHGERRRGRERRISAAQRIMIETATEIERVRPVSGTRAHVEAAQAPDPIQRIIDKAVQEVRRTLVETRDPPLAHAGRQTAVARQSKTAARPRAGAPSRSNDSSRAPAKSPHK